MAVIGIIALIGIEVKNSILLVDYTDQLRKGGMSLDDAIQEAGETRFVPIILTTLTAIGGLMPLVIENNPLLYAAGPGDHWWVDQLNAASPVW